MPRTRMHLSAQGLEPRWPTLRTGGASPAMDTDEPAHLQGAHVPPWTPVARHELVHFSSLRTHKWTTFFYVGSGTRSGDALPRPRRIDHTAVVSRETGEPPGQPGRRAGLGQNAHLPLSQPNHAGCAGRRVRLVLQVVPAEGWDVRVFHVKPKIRTPNRAGSARQVLVDSQLSAFARQNRPRFPSETFLATKNPAP